MYNNKNLSKEQMDRIKEVFENTKFTSSNSVPFDKMCKELKTLFIRLNMAVKYDIDCQICLQ